MGARHRPWRRNIGRPQAAGLEGPRAARPVELACALRPVHRHHGYIYGIYMRWGERQLTNLRHLPMSTSATTRLPSYLSTRLITYRSGMLGAYSELSYLALALCCLSSRLGCYSRLSAPIGTSRHLAVQRSEHLRCTCTKYFSCVLVCDVCRVSCVIAFCRSPRRES